MAALRKTFILTQFGTPHSWTQKFIDHVAFLGKYGWNFLIFSPNKLNNTPDNVTQVYMTADGFANLVQEKLGLRPDFYITKSGVPSIHITDFCIMYGVIFEDYLKDSYFWGMCGWDVLFGRLDHFLPDHELDKYDIWSDDIATINGTFCLFRNVEEVNNLFKKSKDWQEVILQPTCPRCVSGAIKHTLKGSDEYGMTDIVNASSEIAFGYPKYSPLHSHDRMENHKPDIKLDIKEDHSLWELFTDINPPKWKHARPFLEREIPYFHFMTTKRWPLDDRFLEYDSKWDATYGPKLRKRYMTMRIALNYLYQQPRHNIVETGCIRHPDDYGGGNSTYIFGEFVHKYGGQLITIDINPANMEVAKEATKQFAENITYVTGDSLERLPMLTKPIDLLYLDSMDAPETGDATACQEHNLKEFKLAEPLLHKGSLILIDDNDMENGGKSRLTKAYLQEKGYTLLMNSAQSLWVV